MRFPRIPLRAARMFSRHESTQSIVSTRIQLHLAWILRSLRGTKARARPASRHLARTIVNRFQFVSGFLRSVRAGNHPEATTLECGPLGEARGFAEIRNVQAAGLAFLNRRIEPMQQFARLDCRWSG